MKIVQINNHYKFGSTGKIVDYLHNGNYDSGNESYVIYGRGKKIYAKNIFKTSNDLLSKLNGFFSKITGFPFRGNFISTKRILLLIKKIKPDLVHLQNLYGNYVNVYDLLNFLKKNNFPTIITLHSEFMFTGGCTHSFDCNKWKNGCGRCPVLKKATGSLFFDQTANSWKLMKDAIDGFQNLNIVAVSKWLCDKARISPILNKYPIEVIYNGIDTSIFKYYEINELKNKKKSKTILFVTPHFSIDKTDLKGGLLLVKIAQKLIDDGFTFLVVGGKHFIPNLPKNIVQIGIINNPVLLAKYYSMADLTILLSKKETFSLVTIESLACGTPVVGFKSGGPEEIAPPNFSEFCDYGENGELILLIKKWINKKSQISPEIISNYVKQNYSKELMIKKYLFLYNKAIKG
jgi:putative colanic acid biosynthesis glycosyltransferase